MKWIYTCYLPFLIVLFSSWCKFALFKMSIFPWFSIVELTKMVLAFSLHSVYVHAKWFRIAAVSVNAGWFMWIYVFLFSVFWSLRWLCLILFCYILSVTSLYMSLHKYSFTVNVTNSTDVCAFCPKPWSNRQHQVTIFNNGSFKLDLIDTCRICHPFLVVDLGCWPWNPGIGLDAL